MGRVLPSGCLVVRLVGCWLIGWQLWLVCAGGQCALILSAAVLVVDVRCVGRYSSRWLAAVAGCERERESYGKVSC